MKIFIIAEAGVNHNGSLGLALELVRTAAAAGADAVKFQSFRAEKLATSLAPKAGYQVETTGGRESQLEMLARLELTEEAHREIVGCCREAGIEFMSTPFDHESLALLLDLGVSRLKIPSGEITNAPLLLDMAKTNLPLIVSTGMCSLGDIETALGVLAFGLLRTGEQPSAAAFEQAYSSVQGQSVLKDKIILLHCTTQYPTPYEDVNLRAMDTLAKAFSLRVGYSDHTLGIVVPIAAAARGAVVIEKHFTLDKSLPGPDHRASLEPDELKAMVRAVRNIEQALGSGVKKASPSELENKAVVRKSLVAAKNIQSGDTFSPQNLTCKRPGTGISPMRYFDFLGRTAARNYHKDEMISQ